MLDALNLSLRNAYGTAERLALPTKAAPSGMSLLGSQFGMAGSPLLDNSEASAARVLYSHFRGPAYAAINVIAKRIAGQPMIVARIGKPKSKSRSLKAFLQRTRMSPKLIHPQIKRYAPEDVEILQDHPIYDLFESERGPNDFLLPSNLWMLTVARPLLTVPSLAR